MATDKPQAEALEQKGVSREFDEETEVAVVQVKEKIPAEAAELSVSDNERELDAKEKIAK